MESSSSVTDLLKHRSVGVVAQPPPDGPTYHISKIGWYVAAYVGACGLVDRALDSILKGLGFDSQCWTSAEMVGKLLTPYCLYLLNSDRYLVDEYCD